MQNGRRISGDKGSDDMADGLDNFLGEMLPEGAAATSEHNTPAPQPEAPKAPEPTPAPTDQGQPRQPDGKFAPVAPTEAAPVVPAVDDPEKAPVSRSDFKGYLDERDKRQKLEAEAKTLREQIAAFQNRQPQHIPSASDPEAFAQYVEQTKTNTVFDVSETMAREKHGDEPVAQAMDWALQKAQQSPAFAAEYLRQKHPIDWAVKQQKADKLVSEIGNDPEAYKARIIAEHLASIAANPTQAAQPLQAATPNPSVPRPPRSLASQPNAGAPPANAEVPDNPLEMLTADNLRKRNG